MSARAELPIAARRHYMGIPVVVSKELMLSPVPSPAPEPEPEYSPTFNNFLNDPRKRVIGNH